MHENGHKDSLTLTLGWVVCEKNTLCQGLSLGPVSSLWSELESPYLHCTAWQEFLPSIHPSICPSLHQQSLVTAVDVLIHSKYKEMECP